MFFKDIAESVVLAFFILRLKTAIIKQFVKRLILGDCKGSIVTPLAKYRNRKNKTVKTLIIKMNAINVKFVLKKR
jgi:hypothetical protein